MSQLVHVTHATGRPGSRVYVHGHRLHHGMAGALTIAPTLVAISRRHRDVPWLALTLAAAALAAMWDDRHDFPWCSDRDRFTFPRAARC